MNVNAIILNKYINANRQTMSANDSIKDSSWHYIKMIILVAYRKKNI